MEEGKPGGRVASNLGNDFIDLGCGFCAARQDGERVIETAQIKFDHHAENGGAKVGHGSGGMSLLRAV
jgi:hypothetical protein